MLPFELAFICDAYMHALEHFCSPLNVDHAALSTDETFHNTVVNVTCYDGYTLHGDEAVSTYVTCLENSTWSPPNVTCTGIYYLTQVY